MVACKDCISNEVCFKQTMRKNLEPEGFELDCRNFKSKKCIEVVRCKDCRYWQDNNGGYPHEECRWCNEETPDEDDFCSYGERKEE